MKQETVLKEFRDADALLDGHFVLLLDCTAEITFNAPKY